LGATHIIFSVGTFIAAMMLLSNNNKYLYGKQELKDYYKIMKPWKNTIEQRNYILTYDYN